MSRSRRRGGTATSEDSDTYSRVTLRWDHSEDKATRIIACRNNIQWIIQHRMPGGRWRSQSYCRTRTGLEGLLPGKAEEIRAALPERFPAIASPCSAFSDQNR